MPMLLEEKTTPMMLWESEDPLAFAKGLRNATIGSIVFYGLVFFILSRLT